MSVNPPPRYRRPPPLKNPCPRSNDQNGLEREAVSYEELTATANSVFGEGRWSHAITSQAVDFVEYVMGKYQAGCAAFVRVQLADGTFHEAMGYSTTESSVKGSAIQTARSLSIAVALMKALLCFGGVIAEKVGESVRRAKRRRVDGDSRSQEERANERAARMHQAAAQENSGRESKTKENAIPCVEDNSCKKAASRPTACATPSRNKSPNPFEANVEPSVAGAAEAAPTERDGAASHCAGISDKDPNAASMSEEEIRLERKRKQKQKQEEYKKLMKEKLLKADEKPNPRF